MDLTPQARFQWTDLLRPGVLIAVAGLLVLAVCILKYAWHNRAVDLVANPELVSQGGSSIKLMVWMVGGVLLTLFGALLTFLDFTRRG